MKVPVRFDPEDHRAHRRARQQVEGSSAQGGACRPGSHCHWWAGSPNPPGWTPRTPRRVGVGRRGLGHVGQGIGAALGRGGGVVGVRGRVNDARFRPGSPRRPSSSIPVIAHIPFARADRRRDRLARCWSSEVQVGGVVGLSGNLQHPAHLRGVGQLRQADDRGLFAGEVIDGRGVGQDLIHMQPEILPAAHASFTTGRSCRALAVFTIPTRPPPGIRWRSRPGTRWCLRPGPGNPRRYRRHRPDRSGYASMRFRNFAVCAMPRRVLRTQ